MAIKSSEEILQLKNRIKELEDQLAYNDGFVFMFDEDIPKDQSARKQYVADIAIAYSKFFQKKIPHFISLQMQDLAQIGRTERGTDIIRSNINCFRIIEEWMKEKTNEHLGNLEEGRNGFDVIKNPDDDIINKLRER